MASDLTIAVCLLLTGAMPPPPPASLESEVVFVPAGDSQIAPHGRGNVYAPEILWCGDSYRMWFGAQGRDGHDRIFLATSTDGLKWDQRGVVLEEPSANHCNDPSVVEVNGRFHMFYTRAGAGVTDAVALATSPDGVKWQLRGTVLKPGEPGAWDSLSVGRPSVLVENGLFRMWYDGRKDLPPGAPDPKAPKSDHSQRFVGYATSRDGVDWKKHGGEPVYAHDAGGIHVLRTGGHLSMLVEGRHGTDAATSVDGVQWKSLGRLAEQSPEPRELHGHVTPFLLRDRDGKGATLYFGAAAESAWNVNVLCRRRLSNLQWKSLLTGERIEDAD